MRLLPENRGQTGILFVVMLWCLAMAGAQGQVLHCHLYERSRKIGVRLVFIY